MSDTMETQQAAQSAAIQPGGMVYATNEGEETVTFYWDSKAYTLQPGRKTPITVEAMINHLGDPRSGGNISAYTLENGENGWVPDRAAELRRIRAKYGAGIGTPDWEVPKNAPKVSIEDLEGNKVYTVVDDPDGTKSIASDRPEHETTVSDLQRVIDNLQKQVTELAKAAGTNAGQDVPESAIPIDDESTRPSSTPAVVNPLAEEGTMDPIFSNDPNAGEMGHSNATGTETDGLPGGIVQEGEPSDADFSEGDLGNLPPGNAERNYDSPQYDNDLTESDNPPDDTT